MRKPAPLENPEKMRRAVVRLWENAQLHNLTQKKIAELLGVSLRTVSYWFAGRTPLKAHERIIEEGIKRIEREFPDPVCEEVRPGLYASSAWSVPDDPNDPEIKAEKKTTAELDALYRELEKAARPGERPPAWWADFREGVIYLRRHGKHFRI